MNINARIISIAAIFLIALVALPVMACETPPPTCPPGEMWGQTGQNCYQVPAVYGSCQNCPSHQGCIEYGNQPHWKTADYHDANDCYQHSGHSHSWCNAVDHGVCTDYGTIYDCNYDVNFIKDQCSNHKGKPLITLAHEQCDPTFGCIAVSCPAIPCGPGYTCQDNQCVPDGSCPVTPCNEGCSCVDGQCVQNPVPVCGVDFFCDEGYHCSDNVCAQNPPDTCLTIPCEGDQECIEGVCTTPTLTVLAIASDTDDGRRDGAGFVLWDRLITLTGRDEGYYWNTFNQTKAWLQFNGPGSFNESFIVVQPDYAKRAHAYGLYPADAPGEWTIVLLGTNDIDNPTEPRVLAASHIDVEPLFLDGFTGLHTIVERNRNYVEG